MGSKVVSVTGNDNKVVGGDYVLNIQGAQVPQMEYLTSSQRKQLNALVQDIEARHNEPGAKIWKRVVHIPFGVTKLAEVPVTQYAAVEKALQEFSHVLTLVDKLNAEAQRKHAANQVTQYVLEQFGVHDLKYLKPVELKHALGYLYDLPRSDCGLPFNAVRIGEGSARLAAKRVKPAELNRWWRVMSYLVLRWPGHILAVALASALVTKVLF